MFHDGLSAFYLGHKTGHFLSLRSPTLLKSLPCNRRACGARLGGGRRGSSLPRLSAQRLFTNGSRHWLLTIVIIAVGYIFECPWGAWHCTVQSVYCPVSASESLDVVLTLSSAQTASNTVRCCQLPKVKAFHTVDIPGRNVMRQWHYHFLAKFLHH